jgi:hypothetical protein
MKFTHYRVIQTNLSSTLTRKMVLVYGALIDNPEVPQTPPLGSPNIYPLRSSNERGCNQQCTARLPVKSHHSTSQEMDYVSNNRIRLAPRRTNPIQTSRDTPKSQLRWFEHRWLHVRKKNRVTTLILYFFFYYTTFE